MTRRPSRVNGVQALNWIILGSNPGPLPTSSVSMETWNGECSLLGKNIDNLKAKKTKIGDGQGACFPPLCTEKYWAFSFLKIQTLIIY